MKNKTQLFYSIVIFTAAIVMVISFWWIVMEVTKYVGTKRLLNFPTAFAWESVCVFAGATLVYTSLFFKVFNNKNQSHEEIN
jgi:hypothetical protein